MAERKSWDMILAEVQALDPDELTQEAWEWFGLQPFPMDQEDIIRRDLENAVESLSSSRQPDWYLALERLRGWCSHWRYAHDGATPQEVSETAH